MSQKVQVIAHEVTASKIVTVRPLVSFGAMLSPSAGLTLVLEDGVTHKWLLESGGVAPKVGDLLVFDEMVGVHYIVDTEQFDGLFTETLSEAV